MKVYIVYADNGYGTASVDGVYASEDAAQERVQKLAWVEELDVHE